MVELSRAERALLAQNTWFAGLPQTVQTAILACGTRRTFADGEFLHRRDDAPRGWYAILSGAIKVSTLAPDGRESVLVYLEPGQWFGEISLFDGRGRVHDGIAFGATEILLVSPLAFEWLLEDHPALQRHFLTLMAGRLRLVFAAIHDLALLPLEARLARQLVGLTRTYGRETPEGLRLALTLSQEDLASLVGASRQRVNALLKHWDRDGILVVRYGILMVKDLQQLERIADGG